MDMKFQLKGSGQILFDCYPTVGGEEELEMSIVCMYVCVFVC